MKYVVGFWVVFRIFKLAMRDSKSQNTVFVGFALVCKENNKI